MSAIGVPFRALRPSVAAQLAAGVVLIDAIAVGSLIAAHAPARTVAIVGVAALLVPCALYLAVFIRPVYLISAAVLASMFSGNWHQIGFPSMVAPDRFFFIVGIGAFILRDPATGERRPIRFSYVHVLLGLAAAYAIASAIGAHTLFNKADLWPLVDRFGLVPFALFFIAPALFATERDRHVLLVTLVLMAGYLGWIAAAQGVGAHALVWPRYINNVAVGSHQVGRARGPFGDSATNGLVLFDVAIACTLAFLAFRKSRWRWLIALIGFVCLFDTIFTLQRSVFIGTILGILLMMLAVPKLRIYTPVVVLVGAMIVTGALLASNSLRQQVFDRVSHQQTVWDRYNLDRAAENMFLAKPLTGFGWGSFLTDSINYFKLAATYPITAVGEPDHSVVLSNLAELGLIGTALWAAALVFGIGGAIVRRGPPELYPWRIGLIGVAVMWLAAANLTPLIASPPNQLLWLWAGVAFPVRYGIEALASRRSGLPAVPEGVAPSAARLAAHPQTASAVLHPPAPASSSPRRRLSRGQALLALGVAVLAALGFLAGQLTTGGSAAPALDHASTALVRVDYPSTWQRQLHAASSVPGLRDEVALVPRQPAGTALVVGRSLALDPTLLPGPLLATLPHVPSAQIVTLGAFRMYRYLNLTPRGGPPLASVYALPTTAGTVVGACVAPGTSALFLTSCEHVLASLRLTSARALPLAPSEAYARELTAVISRLNPTRSSAAAQLRGAHDPHTQIKAAEVLATAHGVAAAAISQLPAGAASAANSRLAKALRAVSAGYASLGKAVARNDRRAYASAQAAVMAANQALNSAFVQLAEFGYHVG